jgi:hypothetical protein
MLTFAMVSAFYVLSGACDKGMETMCACVKALYGTKQAAAAWQKFLKALCIAAGFTLPQG